LTGEIEREMGKIGSVKNWKCLSPGIPSLLGMMEDGKCLSLRIPLRIPDDSEDSKCLFLGMPRDDC